MGLTTEQSEPFLNGRRNDFDHHELQQLPSPSEFSPHKYRESSRFSSLLPTSRRRSWPFAVGSALLVLGFLYFLSHLYGHPLFGSKSDEENESRKTLIPGSNFTKPADLKVVGILFYGRRDRVSILDCYLRDNLVENGGILDEIQFMTMTDVPEDVAWLDEAVARTPGYKKIFNETKPKLEWFDGYKTLERGVRYVKIDDDVVYIANDTIPRIVETALTHPEYLVVAANTVNSPLISYIHYMMGVILPFLPEVTPPADLELRQQQKVDWRGSTLPTWEGPSNYTVDSKTKPPFKGHRWLPLKPGTSTDNTPISRAEYNAFGHGWSEWGICAQQHYTFFTRMEQDPTLSRYKFKLWETNYERLSINLITFQGDDILDNGPVPGEDEPYITVDLPKKLQRHVAIDGRAMAAHYSFGAQVAGIDTTDVLERYRSFAEEKVCRPISNSTLQ